MRNQYWFGRWKHGPLTEREVSRLCAEASARRARTARVPLDKVLRVLGETARRWKDPAYGPRRRAERALPAATGFSPAMIRKGIEELCWTFEPAYLQKKIDTELRGYQDGLGDRRWRPVGVVLHVLAGNVFVGAAGSLVEGLITGNVNILKMSSMEKIFLPELARSLAESDPDGAVAGSFAVVDFSSSDAAVIAELKKRVDAVAVWGGEEAVRAYRDGLPARTRLIVFGPKLSLAVVTKGGLEETSIAETARRLAAEAGVWDQNACTAPQACYVEGLENAERLARALPAAFQEMARKLPPGRVDADQAVEIRKLRQIFEVAEARGEGRVLESPRGLDWTVLLDKDLALEPSPLHRTLRVIPYRRLSDVLPGLESLRGYLQTVGLCASQKEAAGLTGTLADLGALRVVALGKMAEGEIDDPHDGRFDLPQFKNLVLARPGAGPDREPAESLTPDARRALIDERLRRLADAARRSPFYSRRLKGVSLDGVADLKKVPILTRDQFESNMPPQGEGLSTGPWTGGYVTRSGGSTGEPKFSIYDGADWERMISHAVGIFRALGLAPSDRLGNFMLAGDLYGSFVSFDHINNRLGLATFAFGGTSTPETFVKVWRQFGLNAVQGIPSQLVPFLRQARKLEPKLVLEKLVYAGTPLSPSDHDWLKSALKISRIASVIGANDGGQIAFQCSRMRGSLHHAVDDFNYLEVVDDAGRPVPAGAPGRLVLTSLLKYAYPLIRYDFGDRGRILPKRCPCGRAAKVLEYLGRSDDTLSVGSMNVRWRDFSAALAGMPLSNLQVAARNEENGESVVVRAETDSPSEGTRSRVEGALLSSMSKLKERLADGSLNRLCVELHEPGRLPRNPRTGKVRAMVDERS